MKIKESNIRRLIRNFIIKEYQSHARGMRPSFAGISAITRKTRKKNVIIDDDAAIYPGGGYVPYDGDMIVKHPSEKDKNGNPLIFIHDMDHGLSKEMTKNWVYFMMKLGEHLSNVLPADKYNLATNGVTRDIYESAYTDNALRTAGSKHGVGLAADFKFHSEKHGDYDSTDKNKILAKDPDLVNAIIDFMDTQKVITNVKIGWGGAFGRGGKTNLTKGQLPVGRGIEEFHHFEVVGSDMPVLLNVINDGIKEVSGGDLSASQITSEEKLLELYKAIMTYEKIEQEDSSGADDDTYYYDPFNLDSEPLGYENNEYGYVNIAKMSSAEEKDGIAGEWIKYLPTNSGGSTVDIVSEEGSAMKLVYFLELDSWSDEASAGKKDDIHLGDWEKVQVRKRTTAAADFMPGYNMDTGFILYTEDITGTDEALIFLYTGAKQGLLKTG